MNIKPIRNNKNYKEALKRIELLWNSESNTPEGDELDIITTLVQAYEAEKYPVLPPDPVEALKFRMEQLQMKPSELALLIGGRNRVSEILHKKRNLTLAMIKVLYKKLNIPAESLLN